MPKAVHSQYTPGIPFHFSLSVASSLNLGGCSVHSYTQKSVVVFCLSLFVCFCCFLLQISNSTGRSHVGPLLTNEEYNRTGS